jgi:hypothetical protein
MTAIKNLRFTPHSLIPQDPYTRKTLLYMFLIYLVRIGIDQWLEYDRGPYGIGWLIICPVPCGILLLFAIFLIRHAVVAVRRTHRLTPVFVLMGGIVSALIIPLPLLPKAIYPEESYFYDHRQEFETVVELAREERLDCGNMGCKYSGRELLEEYKHLSDDGRVYTHYILGETLSDTLVVKFTPFTFYYPIIYFARPQDVNSYSECQGVRWVRKLDEHWYLCVEEWN